MRACFVIEYVGLRLRRLFDDFNVVGTARCRAGSEVFLYKLPQQSVQTVDGHRMLSLIVDDHHETSAFR